MTLQHEISMDDKTVYCKKCGAEIYWLKSKKGKWYPVNHRGIIIVYKDDFHKCGQPSKYDVCNYENQA